MTKKMGELLKSLKLTLTIMFSIITLGVYMTYGYKLHYIFEKKGRNVPIVFMLFFAILSLPAFNFRLVMK